MAIVSNFTVSHRLFQKLQQMSYAIGFDSGISCKVSYNLLPDSNNLHDNNHNHFCYLNPVEHIEFVLEQPAFSEYLSYVQANELLDAEEHIDLELNSSNLWGNELVC